MARILEIISFMISSHAISARIEIGEKTEFRHHGCGVVIHENAVIGNGCIIHQNVTVGQKLSDRNKNDGVPVIGNNVLIGAGAVLIGNIHIGDGAVIGANAVVTKDVREGAIVVGIPADVL